jgi:hypothetical protein
MTVVGVVGVTVVGYPSSLRHSSAGWNPSTPRHSSEGWSPSYWLRRTRWIPACAGMTKGGAVKAATGAAGVTPALKKHCFQD